MTGGASFLVDAMLGSLARKLRMLGFDAEYRDGASPAPGPEAAARLARAGRVLVTRDRALARAARRAGARAVLLCAGGGIRAGGKDAGDLARLGRELGLRPWRPRAGAGRSRCAACNGELEAARGGRPPAGVPPGAARAARGGFRRCRRCSKAYWDGSHMARLRELGAALDA